MNTVVPAITTQGLILTFLPAAIVIGIMYFWRAGAQTAIYATARMLIQLLLIGYVLIYIFETDHFVIIVSVLIIMLVVSSWIAIRPLHERRRRSYLNVLIAISTGGVLTLALVTQLVISVEPWFSPRYVVPLAGMVFASSMNAVSLAAERFEAESGRGVTYGQARRTAFQAALIPITNSLLAVGLVSLPGMMTGQILAGTSPLIAARYQIIVMCMIFSSAGISAALFLWLIRTQCRQQTAETGVDTCG